MSYEIENLPALIYDFQKCEQSVYHSRIDELYPIPIYNSYL